MRNLTGLLMLIVIGTAGCAHVAPKFYAPLQPDGWSAQPVSITHRFTPDATLDPATLTPMGDDGYYFYILIKSGNWDYGNWESFLLSHWRQPWGHSWIILESPTNRLEYGLNGNFGLVKPKYSEGVDQRFKAGDPNPISYLWETMSDGELEIGNGDRTPTFAWRVPITMQRYQLIRSHVTHWRFTQIGVQSNNCVDLVTEAAELAGINTIHRIRLTLPPEINILWKTMRLWTDPKYSILEYSSPDILEVDLRYLAQFGIGSEVTEWYLASDMAASKAKDKEKSGTRAEDGN